MWICVCVLLLPSGTAMAGEIPEVTINSIEITDVSLTPELNITYFDDYNITVSVDSSVPVHTVEFHKEFIDGQNVSNNNTHYYVNGTQTPRSEPYGYHHNLTYTENDGTYHMIQRPDQLYPVITFGLNREIWYNTPQDIPIWQENYQIFHFERVCPLNKISKVCRRRLPVGRLCIDHIEPFFESEFKADRNHYACREKRRKEVS